MTFDSGGSVSLRMIDSCFEQRRGNTKTSVSLVDGKADDPPGPRIIRENPP